MGAAIFRVEFQAHIHRSDDLAIMLFCFDLHLLLKSVCVSTSCFLVIPQPFDGFSAICDLHRLGAPSDLRLLGWLSLRLLGWLGLRLLGPAGGGLAAEDPGG